MYENHLATMKTEFGELLLARLFTFNLAPIYLTDYESLIVSPRWRTKQNLDYSFLMMYAKSRGTYYIQVRHRPKLDT